MKQLFYSLSALLMMLTFMACPYKSKTPIDGTPKEKVNNDYLGVYEKKNSTSYSYEIQKESETTYKLIRTTTKESSTSKPSIYMGYTSTVNSNRYLQMYRESKYSSSKDYYLYRLSMNTSNTILSLEPVTEHIREEFETSRELQNFIAKHQDLSFFFGKTEKYYKSE